MVIRAVVLLLVVGLSVYTFIDCARTPQHRVRVMPRSLWLLATLAVPVIGPAGWLLLGRAAPSAGPEPRPVRKVVAPDDDPDFLMSLELERRRRQREGKNAAGDKPTDDSPSDDSGQAGETREDGDNHSGQAAS